MNNFLIMVYMIMNKINTHNKYKQMIPQNVDVTYFDKIMKKIMRLAVKKKLVHNNLK